MLIVQSPVRVLEICELERRQSGEAARRGEMGFEQDVRMGMVYDAVWERLEEPGRNFYIDFWGKEGRGLRISVLMLEGRLKRKLWFFGRWE